MIEINKQVKQYIFQYGKNKIVRHCGFDSNNYHTIDVISTEPFVIASTDVHILLTNDKLDPLTDNYEYAILVNKKPQKSKLYKGEILFQQWLKHPLFSNISTIEIVNSWSGKFLYTKENNEKYIQGLRSPQLGALYSYLSHEQSQRGRNIIVMPTGTGKTETMLSILIANQCNKLLVTVPSDALREQLYEKFVTLGVLHKFNIVSSDCERPYVAIVKESMENQKWEDVLEHSNVIVTTMPLLRQTDKSTRHILSKSISHVFVDEAHHSEADTWGDVLNIFSDNKITLFTATPFRNDGKKLQGDFIFNFSLKDAQEQGYYKPINFLPVREYDQIKADASIAKVAVARLKEDIGKGFNHILMARCATKKRAEEVLKYYSQYPELNPVIVYSAISGKKTLIENIKRKKHKIIVCVNMLGEGFDLPEMKIAAIHDQKQSIAVTLQFIGRFTRTSYDSNLGDASFITNIAYPPIQEELLELYAKDANWNRLLPIINDENTTEEIDFNAYIHSFHGMQDSKVSFRNIYPALSAIIYRTGSTWNPHLWKEFFKKNEYDYTFGSVNENGDTLVVILGRLEKVIWGNLEEIQNLVWDIVVVHWYCTPKYNHAYLNSSISIDVEEFMKLIFGDSDELNKVSGNNVFRVLSDVKRFAVVNFGGRKTKQGNVSFKSYYGKDVEEGITAAEQSQLSKNNIFGNGFRNGKKISIGCSLKGKIWSYMRTNLYEYTKWAKEIGRLIEDESIDPDLVLRNTIIPKPISELPPVYPIGIDWDPELYQDLHERNIYVRCNSIDYPIWDISIQLIHNDNLEDIDFEILVGEKSLKYKITYGLSNDIPCYKIKQIDGEIISFICGSKRFDNICDYFNQDNSAPVIYFADGSTLFANNLVNSNETSLPFEKQNLIPLDWDGVDLSNESQGVKPYITDSIQYFFSQHIMDKFQILYDDDGAGEIADLIGINDDENHINVYLYHLKFAKKGVISNQISNFYEVCGQAQKSLKWNSREKHRDFISRLFARMTKRYNGQECSRLLKGTQDDLEAINSQINWKKDIKMHIAIVQPALSASNPSSDILNLLGAVATYIKDYSNIDIEVFCSK